MLRRGTVILILGLVLAACGGDDGSSTTTAPQDPSQTTATTPAAPTTTEAAPGVEAPSLEGTSWNVTDYRLPNGSITNVWKTEVTIEFGADGTVSGSAGCNTYTGQWAVSGNWDAFEEGVPDVNDGQVLTLSDLSWTEVACEDEDVMIQETEILDLLQQAGRWVLIRGSFHLRDDTGSYLFEAEPA